MGEVGLDERVAAGVSKNNARRPRSKKHSGNESPHFLETAETRGNLPNNRVTVRNNSESRRRKNRNRDRRVNLRRLKSPRPVFTSAICPSTRPRAISSSSSTG